MYVWGVYMMSSCVYVMNAYCMCDMFMCICDIYAVCVMCLCINVIYVYCVYNMFMCVCDICVGYVYVHVSMLCMSGGYV